MLFSGDGGAQGGVCPQNWLLYTVNYGVKYPPASLIPCSSVIRAFAHGVMGRQIDPSWGGLTELFLIPASAPQLV